MSIHKTEALVLKTFDFRETSLIVTFYTKEFGKIQGLLKGIRLKPDKFASTLEPFSHNEIVFYRKRNTDLHLVTACDLKNNFLSLRNDMYRFGHASYMMELLNALTAIEDKNDAIFNLAMDCLLEMDINTYYERIPTIYKIKALALSGFQPHLNSCVACEDRIISQSKFSSSLGGLLCPKCFKRDIKATWIFRGTIATILYIERNDLMSNLRLGVNPQVKRELDCLLNSFIEFHLEKKFKSQRVMPYLEETLECLGVKGV
ncbi:MAG: DNA repair protein RecO [Candidatus Omnitrophica bacterium]|nr:DNA repair protein RecO [Candidatus Omnitrophota bacterium]